MDFRRIIKFGNSSHVISIPKYWMKKHKLGKGDLVYFSENGNNELLLAAKPESPYTEKKEVSIRIDEGNSEEISRKIVSKYIDGCDLLNITWNENISGKTDDIRGIVQGLMAFEIIEHSKNKIVAKDFLNPSEISIVALIRRIDTLIKANIEDLESTYKTDYQEMYRRDFDVNKICHLLYRVIKKSLNDPILARNLNMTNTDLFNSWNVVHHIERIGDEMKRISKNLFLAKPNKQNYEKFFGLYKRSAQSYLSVMKAYYTKDEDLAYNVAGDKDKIIKECDNLMNSVNNIYFAQAIEKLKTMIVCIRNIARCVYQ